MREDWELISTRCQRLQGEMLAFNVNPSSTTASADRFDDTITSLVRIYMDDEDSPIHDLRYHTRKHYEIKLNGIIAAVGQARVSMLTFRDFKRWHEGWKKPKIEGGLERTARAHGFMSFVRIVFSFGALSELPHCARLHAVLSKMEFPNPKRRTKIINAEQAAAIRKEAHRRGNPSIALAQAFQFDLMLRQKDVVGEWVPTSEPGISDIAYHDKKWLNGLRWEEITGNILKHRLSKSLRGKKATSNPGAGKAMVWHLTSYPMVMEELSRIPEEERQGPIVVAEHNGRPWNQKVFAEYWREYARAVGVPDDVQNRDSRAGGASEAETAGADIEAIRQGMGHSKPDTTRIYTRAAAEATDNVAKLRVKSRSKNGPQTT
jgi:hypothetical protein